MAMMLVKKLGHHHPCCVHGRLSNNPTTIEEAHHKTQNCNVSWSTTLKPPHPATPFVYMSHCERSELQLQMETATANPNAKIPSFCHQHRQISYIHLSRDLKKFIMMMMLFCKRNFGWQHRHLWVYIFAWSSWLMISTKGFWDVQQTWSMKIGFKNFLRVCSRICSIGNFKLSLGP
jgi:hypothetical protein